MRLGYGPSGGGLMNGAQPSRGRSLALLGHVRLIDEWLALLLCTVMLVLAACGTVVLARPGLPLLVQGDEVGFLLGWAVVVLAVAFAGLAAAYGWVAIQVWRHDPVGRLAGATLAGAVSFSVLVGTGHAVAGALGALLIGGNAVLALLCVLGPGLRDVGRHEAMPDMPLSVSAAAVLARAHAFVLLLVGISVFPLGHLSGRLYLYGLVLVALSVTVWRLVARVEQRDLRAGVLLTGLIGVNAAVGLLAGAGQVSWLGVTLAVAVAGWLFASQPSRVWFAAAPLGAPENELPPRAPGGFPRPTGDPIARVPRQPTSAAATLEPAAAGAPVTTPAERPLAVLRCPDGTSVQVAGPLVLGRQPSPSERWADATCQQLLDPARSLSRSHAVVLPGARAGEVVVHDLGSTNGTWVLDGDHTSARVRDSPVTARPGCVLLLGEVSLEVLAVGMLSRDHT